jgi:hypothetical protein
VSSLSLIEGFPLAWLAEEEDGVKACLHDFMAMAMEPSLEWRGGVANAPLPSAIFSHLSVGVQLAEIGRMGWRRRGRPVATYRSTETSGN